MSTQRERETARKIECIDPRIEKLRNKDASTGSIVEYTVDNEFDIGNVESFVRIQSIGSR